jgi:predicted GNAT superfamily acetyltransferase
LSRFSNQPLAVRDIVSSDLPWLEALNRACVPAVDALTLAELERVLASASSTRVVKRGEHLLGALVGFLPGAAYASTNYQWFCRERADFFYIDRVVVALGARGLGVGRALYADALDRALRAGALRLCCEVNEDPPNPASLAFHARLGFTRILSRRDERSGKLVAILERPVGDDAAGLSPDR